MKTGDWIKHTESGTYAIVGEKLKNGAFKVLASQGGKPVQKTTHFWYPEPVVIERVDVPTKIVAKILFQNFKLSNPILIESMKGRE